MFTKKGTNKSEKHKSIKEKEEKKEIKRSSIMTINGINQFGSLTTKTGQVLKFEDFDKIKFFMYNKV